MHKHVIGIQARIGSTRLPGKVMYKLGKSNMNSIELMISRIRANNELSDSPVYILTSTNSEDNAIQYLCDKNSILCLRGDENDVLSRYAQLAKAISTENIID